MLLKLMVCVGNQSVPSIPSLLLNAASSKFVIYLNFSPLHNFARVAFYIWGLATVNKYYSLKIA